MKFPRACNPNIKSFTPMVEVDLQSCIKPISYHYHCSTLSFVDAWLCDVQVLSKPPERVGQLRLWRRHRRPPLHQLRGQPNCFSLSCVGHYREFGERRLLPFWGLCEKSQRVLHSLRGLYWIPVACFWELIRCDLGSVHMICLQLEKQIFLRDWRDTKYAYFCLPSEIVLKVGP